MKCCCVYVQHVGLASVLALTVLGCPEAHSVRQRTFLDWWAVGNGLLRAVRSFMVAFSEPPEGARSAACTGTDTCVRVVMRGGARGSSAGRRTKAAQAQIGMVCSFGPRWPT